MENNSSAQMPPVANGGVASSPNVVAPPPVAPARRSGDSSLIKIVVIILLSLMLVAALLLAYYFFNEYRLAKADVQAQVDTAVLEANKELEESLETEFEKREKEPKQTFTGPADYGSLSFKYPKTWSVYIHKDASNGGDFEAYLHPVEVSPVSDKTINALRVTIKSETFETASNRYKNLVERGDLTASVIQINGSDATRYDGKINNNFVGTVVIIKIRDKVAYLQTDAEIYRDDFNDILDTVTFNN